MQISLCSRRDTAENWSKVNPIQRDGEICLIQQDGEYRLMVIGDGQRAYADLPKIKLGIDAPCYPTINSSSIVANKNLFPWVEDDYFIF